MKFVFIFQRISMAQVGQSLVETALFLPILVLMLGGVVELSNFLITQNRVSMSARVAAGFGASNIVGEDWTDGTDWSGNMAAVALNAVTDTLELTTDRWDIWTIKATTNVSGSDFSEWNAVHAYGDNAVVPTEEWTTEEAAVKSEILAELSGSGGIEAVAAAAFYQAETLLRLPMGNFGEVLTIRGVNVMRVDNPAPYGLAYGVCDLAPISIYYDNYSMYPEGTDPDVVPADPDDPVNIFDSNLDHPDDLEYSLDDTSAFPANVPGIRLLDAQPGYIYRAREDAGPGGFGWLTWTGSTSSVALADSLVYPGNLTTNPDDPDPDKVLYVNPDDPDDHVISIGDWVQGSTGNMNSVKDLLDADIDAERIWRFLVFDDVRGTGSHLDFHVYGFVLVKMIGRQTTGSDKHILIEFIRWDNEACTG